MSDSAGSGRNLPADPADIARLYRSLYRIRRTEEEVARVYPTDAIKSPVHLSIGQEFVAVGVCDVLEPRDWVAGSYRGHAMFLARGGSLDGLVRELYGKVGGCAAGKGGSMHLVDMANGIVGASAVVATQIPVAAGFAYTAQRRNTGAVTVCFLGDGATEEGVFAETLNFAALKALPILFVCENNGLAIHQPLSKRWATDRLTERVGTYGIPTARILDGDLFALRDTAAEFVARARSGAGPAFLEVATYRWKEHVGPAEDYDAGYRERADLDLWQERDSVAALAQLLPADTRAAVEAEEEAAIAAAFAGAEAAPFPDPKDLLSDVYA